MTTYIRNGRFIDGPDLEFTPLSEIGPLEAASGHLDVPSDTDPALITPYAKAFSVIRIDFPSSADGRGNSIARALRNAGFKGTLVARGHVLADQYPLALGSGFDAVEISKEQAARQPQWQWSDALRRTQRTYQDRLKSRAGDIRACA